MVIANIYYEGLVRDDSGSRIMVMGLCRTSPPSSRGTVDPVVAWVLGAAGKLALPS